MQLSNIVVAVLGVGFVIYVLFTAELIYRPNPTTGCMANLNQMGKATLAYLDDFNGYYWTSDQPYTLAMSRYLKNSDVFKCEYDKRNAVSADIDRVTQKAVSGQSAERVSYLCNSNLWARRSGHLRISEIEKVSKFLLFVDDSSGDGSMRACVANPHSASAYHLDNQRGRHNGTDNYLMADTHVKAVKGGRSSGVAEGAVTYEGVTWDPAVVPVATK